MHIAENIYLANLSKNEWRVIPCKDVFSFYIYISDVSLRIYKASAKGIMAASDNG